jgi:hypothetical protein
MIKTIIGTVFFTITVLSIVFSIFLNSILGLFGLVSTSLDTLNQLKDSQEIVETMKERNKSKKKKAPKRFARKAGTRVAASAVAAATIGTAAVTLTVFGLEVHDYCEEREQLLEDENLLNGTEETFNYQKCMSEAQSDSKQILIEAKDSISDSARASWESTTEYTEEQWDDFKNESSDFWDDLMWSTSDLSDSWYLWWNGK